MKLNKLASAILRGSWLLEHRTADGLLPMAHRFLKGEKVSWFDDDDDEDEQDPYLQTYVITPEGTVTKIKADYENQSTNVFQTAPSGSIFILPIIGTIMADDYCGSPGTKTMATWLKDARDSENIIGGVLHINSGGGTVEGTKEFADLVAEIAQEMPLEVYTDGMIASAAYWIASALHITASSETVEIGSIGTAIRFTDYSAYYEELGIKEHYINADPSFDKNADVIEAKKGNYKPIRENILNPTNEIFMNAVKANRGEALQLTDIKGKEDVVIGQEPLTGKMYLAEKAIALGLMDAVGTMDIVFNSIRSQAGAEQITANQQKLDMSLFGTKFPKSLTNIKTKKAADITEEEIEAVNEDFKGAGFENVVVISTSHFEEANANADALESGLTAVNAALGEGAAHKSLDAAINALIADRDDQAKLAEEYGDQPGEKPIKVKSTADSEGSNVAGKKVSEMNELEKKAYKRQQIADKKAKMNFTLEDEQ